MLWNMFFWDSLHVITLKCEINSVNILPTVVIIVCSARFTTTPTWTVMFLCRSGFFIQLIISHFNLFNINFIWPAIKILIIKTFVTYFTFPQCRVFGIFQSRKMSNCPKNQGFYALCNCILITTFLYTWIWRPLT